MDEIAARRLLSGEAWEDFCESLKSAGRIVEEFGDEPTDLDRAEWYRFLSRLVRNGFERFVENCEPERPRLRDAAWRGSINVQSPDQDHFLCEFPNGAHEYRITGQRGTLPYFAKLPYLPEMALEALTGKRVLVLAGALSPVGFFGWPGMPSSMVPEGTETVTLALPDEDIVAALEALAGRLNAPAYEPPAAQAAPALPEGTLTSETLCGTIAALQPENAILANEAITSGWSYHQQSRSAPRFTELSITGGAIGCGPSLALGAALAAPDRPVINLQADGSGLYTPQALWTQAREGAKVITVICSNRRYNLLQVELARAGLNRPGPNAQSLTELDHPAVDWPVVARGFGVEACAVERADELADALRQAFARGGPTLIEAVIS